MPALCGHFFNYRINPSCICIATVVKMLLNTDRRPAFRDAEEMTVIQDYDSNAYIGRAISHGIRNKKRAPFQAPANAKLKAAIDRLYKSTPGAHTGTSRNAFFDIRYVLADGTEKRDFGDASTAMQAGQSVRVQMWECTKEPTPFPESLFSKDAHDGEFVMRAEKTVALTPREFEKHAR